MLQNKQTSENIALWREMEWPFNDKKYCKVSFANIRQ